jgi:hypothetical protein
MAMPPWVTVGCTGWPWSTITPLPCGAAGARQQRHQTLLDAAEVAFKHYGLPKVVRTDNGSPWRHRGERSLIRFGIWLIENGAAPWHSPLPAKPRQESRMKTFTHAQRELLDWHTFGDLAQAQHAFDLAARYNYHRPHDALGLPCQPTASNPVNDPSTHVEPFDYAPGDILRRVDDAARIRVLGKCVKASRLKGKHVADAASSIRSSAVST